MLRRDDGRNYFQQQRTCFRSNAHGCTDLHYNGVYHPGKKSLRPMLPSLLVRFGICVASHVYFGVMAGC